MKKDDCDVANHRQAANTELFPMTTSTTSGQRPRTCRACGKKFDLSRQGQRRHAPSLRGLRGRSRRDAQDSGTPQQPHHPTGKTSSVAFWKARRSTVIVVPRHQPAGGFEPLNRRSERRPVAGFRVQVRAAFRWGSSASADGRFKPAASRRSGGIGRRVFSAHSSELFPVCVVYN